MVQYVKGLAAKAQDPEFNPWNPEWKVIIAELSSDFRVHCTLCVLLTPCHTNNKFKLFRVREILSASDSWWEHVGRQRQAFFVLTGQDIAEASPSCILAEAIPG